MACSDWLWHWAPTMPPKVGPGLSLSQKTPLRGAPGRRPGDLFRREAPKIFWDMPLDGPTFGGVPFPPPHQQRPLLPPGVLKRSLVWGLWGGPKFPCPDLLPTLAAAPSSCNFEPLQASEIKLSPDAAITLMCGHIVLCSPEGHVCFMERHH